MPQTCPRCSRINPPEALFCFLDGHALGDLGRHSVEPAKQRFPMPFVFPDGKRCHTFDELALACIDRWDVACGLLGNGLFVNFLGGLGRADLVEAARQAAAGPDRDRALDELLGHLPTTTLQPARLVVEPTQINLGAVEVGQDTRFTLHLANHGMGLVQGSVSVEDAPWLFLGEQSARSRKKLFQFLHDAEVAVQVRGKSLTAAGKPLEARIVIQSSAGSVTVPVRLEVPVRPFPEGALAGATTPRQVASLARANPREVADLFARGAVARWYADNGWTYPVQEASASGVAAVQQFFEAVGLTKPPKVGISVCQIDLEGRGGDILRSSLQVVAQEKRPVYAHAVSDQPWLQVNEVALDGRTATVHLRVAGVPDRPGETLHANLTVTANGRQCFVVPVRLAVTGPADRPDGPGWSSSHHAPPPVRFRPAELEEVLPVVQALPEVEDEDDERRPVNRSPGCGALLAVLPVVFLALAWAVLPG